MDFRYLPVRETTITACEARGSVSTSCVPPNTRARIDSHRLAVTLSFGPMRLEMTPSEAIEIGNAMIEAAHHFRAHAHELLSQTELVGEDVAA